jgi:tetratricopeptide (TPR) repeat protein
MDRRVPTLVVAVAIAIFADPDSLQGQDAAESRRLRAKALECGYSLDHDQALATLEEAIAADPTNPATHRLAAATIWIQLLFEQGAVTADDYLGQARSTVERRVIAPERAATFHTHLNRAIRLAETRVRTNPRDSDAHFQLGAAYGFRASYITTVEGRVLGGFGDARRAFREHRHVLELEPSRTDAALIVGMYRYGISQLPIHWRLLAGFAGFEGGGDEGIRLVERAAATTSDIQTNARFTLIVIYNREERYNDALRVIRELQTQYPRNRLLWLEAGTTALRAKRFDVARALLQQGLAKLAADGRARAFGEEARWRYAYGAALVGMNERELAERELRIVLAIAAPRWVQGRAHKELGKLADLAGDRPAAIREYRAALGLCRAGRDLPCTVEAKQLLQIKGDQP